MGRANPYRFSSPQPGWAESLTEPWWGGILQAVRRAIASVDADSVVAIGIAGVASMRWIMEHRPDAYRRTQCFGFANTSAVRRLTGQVVTDISKADITQKPLDVLRFQETASPGGALMAGVGVGVYDSVDHAARVARQVHQSHRVEPRREMVQRYESLYYRYRDLYESTRDIMTAFRRRSCGRGRKDR